MCLAVLLAIGTSHTLQADEKRHRELIEEYIKVSDYEKATTIQIDLQVEMLVKAYPDDYKEHQGALKRTYQRIYAWKKLKPEIVKVIMKHFSESEMEDIEKFSKSPTGQKFIKKMPEVAKSTLEVSMKLAGGDGEAMKKIFEEEVAKDKCGK